MARVSERSELVSLNLPLDDESLNAVRPSICPLTVLPAKVRRDLATVAEELVANVLAHAVPAERDRFSISITLGREDLMIEVTDSGPGFSAAGVLAARSHPSAHSLGLFIVEQLSDGWGTKHEGDFTVWARLRLPRAM
jgi:anti-sigma regulatory factor (Ser/Thr protein kinase)